MVPELYCLAHLSFLALPEEIQKGLVLTTISMKTKLLALLTAILSLSTLSSCMTTPSRSDDDSPHVRRTLGGYHGGGQGGGFGGNFGGF